MMDVLKVVLSVGSLLEHHLLSNCLQMCFAALSSGVYQLVCLVCVWCLLALIGATWSALFVIQVVKFVMA